ncbi:MAG: hypothetical protein ACYC6I_06750 [Bacillota bacterium]
MRSGWHLRRREVPSHARVVVKPGQWVGEDDPVATIDYEPGRLTRVPVAVQLAVAPHRVNDHVLRPTGRRVRSGEVLAAAVCLGHPMVSLAPADGQVTMVSRRLGYVYVREALGLVGTGAPPVTADVFPDLALPKAVLRQCLLVNEGDEVRFGQALASSNAIRLWKQTFAAGKAAKSGESCVAPVSGLVERIDLDRRTITIRPKETASFVVAGIPGRVTAVTQDGVDIAVHGPRFVGAYGTGGEAVGPLSLDDRPENGAVWVRCGRVTLAELQAAREAGVLAVWAASATYEDLHLFLGGRRLGTVSRAGAGPVVVVSEGFGDFRLPPGTTEVLRGLRGRRALVDGATQLRAGAIRPEMIVFDEDATGEDSVDRRDDAVVEGSSADDWPTPGTEPIIAGDEVRCFSGKNLGRTGRVVAPPRPGRLESGLQTLLVEVAWAGGGRDVVASRNLSRLATEDEGGGQGHDRDA